MAIRITRLGENNTELLVNLDEDIFDEKIDSDRLAAYLKEQNHIMLVAISDSDGAVIGQVLAVIHRYPDKPTELYIDDLAVSDKFQRKKIAHACLKNCLRLV